jgi:hypothetical protein
MQRDYTRRRFLGLFGSATFAGATAVASIGSLTGKAAAACSIAATPTAGGLPADELLLRVELKGGFVPVEYLLTSLPIASIYADGRVITTGPMIEIFPQPALPNLRQTVLTQAGIDRVLEEARKADLFEGSTHLDGPEITDLPDTVFTLNAEGISTVVSAYALGVDETMLSASANKEARAKLIELQSFLTDLPSHLSADGIKVSDQPYEIERIRINALEFDPANPPWDDPAMAQEPVAWPLSKPLSELGEALTDAYLAPGTRCAVLEGDDASNLVAALKAANQLTPWESQGGLYLLWNRPLLPDEPASCN